MTKAERVQFAEYLDAVMGETFYQARWGDPRRWRRATFEEWKQYIHEEVVQAEPELSSAPELPEPKASHMRPERRRMKFLETATDPNHTHYWGLKKAYKRYVIVRCQVCGLEQKRKIDWNTITSQEVPDIET